MVKMFSLFALTLFFYVSGVITVKIQTCKKSDSDCLTKTLNDIHPIVLSGIPSLGVESSDPMFLDVIEGDFPTLKYKYTNSTVTGFKDCSLKNVILSPDTFNVKYEMDCPKISISGNYEMSGKLISLPVEGKGTFKITTGRYWIEVDENLKSYIAGDSKIHATTKDYSLKIEALEPIHFEFNNLFNGQKDLSDAVHKFAHDNWKKISEFLQEPIFRKNIDTIYYNYNQFLKTTPLDEFLVD